MNKYNIFLYNDIYSSNGSSKLLSTTIDPYSVYYNRIKNYIRSNRRVNSKHFIYILKSKDSKILE